MKFQTESGQTFTSKSIDINKAFLKISSKHEIEPNLKKTIT